MSQLLFGETHLQLICDTPVRTLSRPNAQRIAAGLPCDHWLLITGRLLLLIMIAAHLDSWLAVGDWLVISDASFVVLQSRRVILRALERQLTRFRGRGVPDCLEKSVHPGQIFDAWSAFHATSNIHGKGAHVANCSSYVVRI